MNRIDFLVENDNVLRIENGDFVVGLSDVQHVDHIITAQPGEFKQFPLVGFGVQNYLKTNTPETKFKRDLRVQLNYDGYIYPNIDLRGGLKELKVEV